VGRAHGGHPPAVTCHPPPTTRQPPRRLPRENLRTHERKPCPWRRRSIAFLTVGQQSHGFLRHDFWNRSALYLPLNSSFWLKFAIHSPLERQFLPYHPGITPKQPEIGTKNPPVLPIDKPPCFIYNLQQVKQTYDTQSTLARCTRQR
jgi:hypothetical protein